MRRPLNWFVVLLSAAVLFVSMALPGCGSSGGDAGGDPPAAGALLRQVRSDGELETALKTALIASHASQDPVPVPGGDAALGSFSSTYTAEPGVDELDYVRYDGTTLFVAPAHDGLSPDQTVIRVLRTDPASATAAQIASIPLDSSQSVLGMYVANGRLFLVTSEAYFGPYGDLWSATVAWAPTRFGLQVHDVSDPARPRKLMGATIDGVFVASRRIDDRVVLVSRHAPRALIDPAQRGRIAQLPLAELLPGITIDGRTGLLVDPRRCFVANEARSGYPVLTSISTFSLANPRDFDGVCYDEPADGVYASRDALYVSEPRFGAAFSSSTRIHKFSLRGARPSYAGSAELPGAVWTGGQQDFRMSESDGLLRVFTTQWTGDPSDFVDHRLFVLRQKPGAPTLEIMGRLPNDAHPEEIGKPNEDLFAVRFVGDRAYAVTFQRVDPLYAIDLSAPADPRIAGQLLLPGVSDFLHPVTDELLLGLGRDAAHFKLELYDTSELARPQSRGAITLGGTGSDSQALRDRHAFAYLAGAAADRLAVPADIFTGQPSIGFGVTTALYQFEIVGKQAASSALLIESGTVAPPSPALPAAFANRAFINGDTVYYVRDGRVWGTFWATPTQVNGPF